MLISALTLITKAFQDCGIVKMNEPVDPAAIANALIDLNMLVDALGVQSLMAMAEIKEAFPLVAGKRLYTIGIGADFNTSKPWSIKTAYITDNLNNVYDVGITDQSLIDTYEDALITSTRPTELAYDEGPTQQAVPWGVITMYPIPDALLPYMLYLSQTKPFTEFMAQTDTVSFPSYYYLALRYSLAEILWPQYRDDGTPVSGQIRGKAAKWMAVVTAKNAKPSISGIELGRKGRAYDINKGPYGGTA